MSGNSLEERALRVGEACDAAWAAAHADTRLNVPLAVVAALSVVRQRDADGPDLAEQFRAMDPDELISVLRGIWRQFVRGRPDLFPVIHPLVGPLFEEVPDKVKAGAFDVTHAALNAGILELTGTDDRFEVDTLGIVWTSMLPAASRRVDAKFYTPGDVGELMARLVGLPAPGESVMEPACGTGGLFRAAAWEMRLAKLDPATVTWVGTDVDELAVAYAAVNAVNWGLGRNVILAVADVLRDPVEPINRAIAMRRECVEIAERLAGVHALAQAVKAGRGTPQHGDQAQEEEVQPGADRRSPGCPTP